MNEIRKAASAALDAYVKSQKLDGESEAQTYDRLIKARDENLAELYAASQGRGVAMTKAKHGNALDRAIEDRVQKFRRDDETFEQALARCAREDTVTRALYAVAHG